MELQNVGPNQDGIDPINRAEMPEVAGKIKQDILGRLDGIRADKQGLHAEWGACFDVWNLQHRVRLYEGASDLYMPVTRNIVETFVAQIKGGVFPTTARFFVEANQNSLGPSPQAIGGLIRHCVEQAQVERHIEGLIRNALIYGTAIAKFPWLTRTSQVYRRRPMLPPEITSMLGPGMGSQIVVQKEAVRTYNGPAFRVVDPFRFFIDPITVTDIDMAQLVFEDIDVSYSHLQAMEKAGIYFDVKRVKEHVKTSADTDGDRNKRLAKYGLAVDPSRNKGGRTGPGYGDQFTITEIWCMYDLEGTGEEIPCKIVTCGDYVLEARANPFFHQRAPYRAWKMIDFPDLFFGQGIVTGLKHQNYAVNALTNQGIDAAVYQSNPIIIANAHGLAQGVGSIKIGHRSIIYVNGKPLDNIEFAKIPDTSPTAFSTASLIMQAMRDMAGAPPILQGKLGNKDTTATEASILGNNAQSGVDNFIRSLEASILSPMLFDWYLLLQQFLDEQVWFKVGGEPKPFGLSADDLVGDYKFRWLVSTQMRDEMGAMQEGMMMDQMKMMKDGGMMTPGQGAQGQTPAEMGGEKLPPGRPPR